MKTKKNFKKNLKKNKDIITSSLMLLVSISSLIVFILFFENLDLRVAILLGTGVCLGMVGCPVLLDIVSCFFETTETEEESDSDL